MITVWFTYLSAPGEDFKHVQDTLLIPACSMGEPLHISIINDTIDEREEMFGLSIDVQEQEGISIQQGTTNITITDGKRVDSTWQNQIYNIILTCHSSYNSGLHSRTVYFL